MMVTFCIYDEIQCAQCHDHQLKIFNLVQLVSVFYQEIHSKMEEN